jgi:hypothetical protein
MKKKKLSCHCGRNVTGSGFYQDHGSCEHCYYDVPDPERSEGKATLRISKESLKEAIAE